MDAQKGSTIISGIRAALDTLHAAERKVADFIIKYPDIVLKSTVLQMAESCNTSEATIVRFCQKLGYKGFYQLKINLARDFGQLDTEQKNFSCGNGDNDVKKLFFGTIRDLQKTAEMIDMDVIKQCAGKILLCNAIYFVAAGNTIPVALDACFRFNTLGFKAYTNTIREYMIAQMNTIGPGDIIFAISRSGSSRFVTDYVELARQKGALAMAVTNNAKSPLSEIADINISMPVDERSYIDSSFHSKVCEFVIMDLLISRLIEMSKKDRIKQLDFIENILSENKF